MQNEFIILEFDPVIYDLGADILPAEVFRLLWLDQYIQLDTALDYKLLFDNVSRNFNNKISKNMVRLIQFTYPIDY